MQEVRNEHGRKCDSKKKPRYYCEIARIIRVGAQGGTRLVRRNEMQEETRIAEAEGFFRLREATADPPQVLPAT